VMAKLCSSGQVTNAVYSYLRDGDYTEAIEILEVSHFYRI